MKKLSAEQIQDNWKKLLDTIEGFISDDRKDNLLIRGGGRPARALISTALSRSLNKSLLIVVPTLEEAARWTSLLQVMGWENIATTGFKLGKNQKISLAVFNLKTAGVSENIAANLTQVLSAALKEVEGTTVISNDDIQAMMQLEGEKQ